MTPFAGPFIAYQSEVRADLVKRGAYVSPGWFGTQMRRVAMAYDLGEPVALCGETLALFARGARTPKTPRQLAIRVVQF